MEKQNRSDGSQSAIEAAMWATRLPKRRTVQPVNKTRRLSIDEINAVIRHIGDTWTPAMDEEIERATVQYRQQRCAKLKDEKRIRTQQRAQLKRELKTAVVVKVRGDARHADAELARIRTTLTDLELRELNATVELHTIRAQMCEA
ncbi:hypothetical protein [Ralstonia pseudosolanacearum]|uniref:hypothetical protein n=1 Tax=Ralstonia pseudosolanacearum TaxID=1310165 RepID=UPI000A3F3659|nr:hypothetical protein [Ralstonia pseudosolanacearum]